MADCYNPHCIHACIYSLRDRCDMSNSHRYDTSEHKKSRQPTSLADHFLQWRGFAKTTTTMESPERLEQPRPYSYDTVQTTVTGMTLENIRKQTANVISRTQWVFKSNLQTGGFNSLQMTCDSLPKALNVMLSIELNAHEKGAEDSNIRLEKANK